MSEVCPVDADDRLTVNFEQACEIVGRELERGRSVRPRTLKRWMEDPEWPVRYKGGSHGVPYEIDAQDLKEWCDSVRTKMAEGEQKRREQFEQLGFDLEEFEDETAQRAWTPAELRTLTQTRIDHLRLAEKRHRTYDRAAAREAWQTALEAIRSQVVDHLPDEISHRLALGREERGIVEDLCCQALREAMGAGRHVLAELDDDQRDS